MKTLANGFAEFYHEMKIQSKDLRCRNYQKDMPKIAYCDGVVNLDAERLQDSVQLFPHFLVDYDGAPVILETVSS